MERRGLPIRAQVCATCTPARRSSRANRRLVRDGDLPESPGTVVATRCSWSLSQSPRWPNRGQLPHTPGPRWRRPIGRARPTPTTPRTRSPTSLWSTSRCRRSAQMCATVASRRLAGITTVKRLIPTLRLARWLACAREPAVGSCCGGPPRIASRQPCVRLRPGA